MAVFRIEKTRDYTIMSNRHLRDNELSLKAKGLLSLILSLPEAWDYSVRGIASICKEGVDCIGATIRELEAAGYIVRNRLRDERGRISDTEYIIRESPEKPILEPAYPQTEKSYTEEVDTDFTPQLSKEEIRKEKSTNQQATIYPIHPPVEEHRRSARTDKNSMERYRQLILENIEYNYLVERYPRQRLDEVVALLLEAICSNRKYLRVAGAEFPQEVVKSRLLKLDNSHVEYAFDCLDKNTTKVRNVKNYLLTTLYNAPATIDSYYRAQVQHDLYGSGGDN